MLSQAPPRPRSPLLLVSGGPALLTRRSPKAGMQTHADMERGCPRTLLRGGTPGIASRGDGSFISQYRVW